MKIIIAADNKKNPGKEAPFGWYYISDSALTNTGKPFYLPENMGDIYVSLGLAIRISRLGKNINKKFADRYYIEEAPALHFIMKDYQERLKDSGLPEDAARNFDRSLFIGDFDSKGKLDEIKLFRNGELVAISTSGDEINAPQEMIEKISRLNTLKMGDIIIPRLSEKIKIKEGDLLEVKKDENTLFYVKIK